MTHIRQALRKFTKDQTGSYAVEGVIILPLLIWSVMASVVFVDAFRMQTLNLRATYVVSDAVSRLWDPVTDDYFVGLAHLHGMQVNFAYQTHLRMSVVQWSEDEDEYKLRWSQTTTPGTYDHLDQAMVDSRETNVPDLADGDSLVLVETWMDYEPPFAVGLPAMTFGNHIFVSPRYTPQIGYEASDGEPTT